MSLDPRRRQKKIERKKAKYKERKVAAQRNEKLAAAREKALIAVSPIYACRVQSNLYTEGIAQAILARELPDHRLATAIYLIDAYCLGIKDSFYKILTRTEYQEIMAGLEKSGTTRALEPAAMKRLIDGVIAYARQLGFEPHRDPVLLRRAIATADRIYQRIVAPVLLPVGQGDANPKMRAGVEARQRRAVGCPKHERAD